jgi:hypothetical protein
VRPGHRRGGDPVGDAVTFASGDDLVVDLLGALNATT